MPAVRELGLEDVAARAAIALALIGACSPARLGVGAGRATAAPDRAGAISTRPAATPCGAARTAPRGRWTGLYDGPLYQVKRQSDDAVDQHRRAAGGRIQRLRRRGRAGRVLRRTPSAGSPVLYDQSAMHNDLAQAPRGGFSGLASEGSTTIPIAGYGADHDPRPQGLWRVHRDEAWRPAQQRPPRHRGRRPA